MSWSQNATTLNQVVKRNIKRFPADFMFQLDENEVEILWSQFVTANLDWSKNDSYHMHLLNN
jgi:hypothetical protein